MPAAMFKPRAAALKRVDFATVKTLAKVFATSLTATAIRLVEHGPLPAILVCASSEGVEWFVRQSGIKSLWPQRPVPETYAYDVLTGREDEGSGEVRASAWFDHPIADRDLIHEQSIRAYRGLASFPSSGGATRLCSSISTIMKKRDARRSDSWRR